MVNIEIDVDTGEPAPVRERFIFAFGLVKFKSSRLQKADNDEMRVLGLVVVQDQSRTLRTNSAQES